MNDELSKMRNGEWVTLSDKEIRLSLKRTKELVHRLNTQTYLHSSEYRKIIKELVPFLADTSDICPPFFCDYGDGIRIGEHSFVNVNCTFLDGAFITIGDNVRIGPNVQIYTAHHSLNYIERRTGKETAFPVTIGNDCWIGGGTIILPGVNIGSRCVIGAGSVVTKNIPADSLAVGNPAHIIRQL